jgi:hypothetical protein
VNIRGGGYVCRSPIQEVSVSDGLFAMTCPSCVAQLVIDAHGDGWCPQCAHTFALRFGMLVPLDGTPRGTSELTVPELAL